MSLNALAEGIDLLNEWLGKIAAWSVFATVIITFTVVIFRYGFTQFYSIALYESALYFHAMIFMLGAAYTLKHDQHVRVDIFYHNLTARKQAVINIFGALFLLIPVCIFIIWVSSDYVLDSWKNLEGSREAGGLPFVFILKSLIPLMAVLLLLQAFSSLIHALNQLTTKGEQ
jgi:TRAP-type mannitol/chloroaromatic compound transport system permease small subunit